MAIRPDYLNIPLMQTTGAVVIWWGRIEGLLFQELLWMKSVPAVVERAFCEPLQIASERMIAQWAKAARIIAVDDLERCEVSEIKTELTACAAMRHLIVHGFWDYPAPDQDPDESGITLVKPIRDGLIQFSQHRLTLTELKDFHDRLARLYHRAMALTMNQSFRHQSHPQGEQV